jgi:DNA-binding MarR family transcriptional regulator
VTTIDRDANILGALARIITDRTDDAIVAAAGQSASAAVALSALHHLVPDSTVDTLRRVLGLTPSGAVRLVDRLAGAGLVIRGPGPDGRSRSVTQTRPGRVAAERVTQARASVLATALADLSLTERATFTALAERVLAALVTEKVTTAPAAGGWTCRLCDARACGRSDGLCPTATAARAAMQAAGGVSSSARAS